MEFFKLSTLLNNWKKKKNYFTFMHKLSPVTLSSQIHMQKGKKKGYVIGGIRFLNFWNNASPISFLLWFNLVFWQLMHQFYTYLKMMSKISDRSKPAWCLKCQDPGSKSQKICQFLLVTFSLNVQKGRGSTFNREYPVMVQQNSYLKYWWFYEIREKLKLND